MADLLALVAVAIAGAAAYMLYLQGRARRMHERTQHDQVVADRIRIYNPELPPPPLQPAPAELAAVPPVLADGPRRGPCTQTTEELPSLPNQPISDIVHSRPPWQHSTEADLAVRIPQYARRATELTSARSLYEAMAESLLAAHRVDEFAPDFSQYHPEIARKLRSEAFREFLFNLPPLASLFGAKEVPLLDPGEEPNLPWRESLTTVECLPCPHCRMMIPFTMAACPRCYTPTGWVDAGDPGDATEGVPA